MTVTLNQGSTSILSEPNANISLMDSLTNYAALLSSVGDTVIETKRTLQNIKDIDAESTPQTVIVSPDNSGSTSTLNNFLNSFTNAQVNLIKISGLSLLGLLIWKVVK